MFYVLMFSIVFCCKTFAIMFTGSIFANVINMPHQHHNLSSSNCDNLICDLICIGSIAILTILIIGGLILTIYVFKKEIK